MWCNVRAKYGGIRNFKAMGHWNSTMNINSQTSTDISGLPECPCLANEHCSSSVTRTVVDMQHAVTATDCTLLYIMTRYVSYVMLNLHTCNELWHFYYSICVNAISVTAWEEVPVSNSTFRSLYVCVSF